MFSQTAEYVLRVVVHLASQEGTPATTRNIAQATKVPEGYLAKLMQSLVKAGLVDSQRGLYGGFVLARDPHELSVYDVIQAIDPIRRICKCPLDIKSHAHELCPLHKRMDDALGLVENALKQSKIAELLVSPGTSKPLCETK